MDWLLINSKAPKTDIILAMHAVLVRHHEAETNIYGCNMYLIGGIKKFNRVPVTPLLISTLKLTRSPRCYHCCTRPFGLFFFSRPIIFLFSHFREGNVIKKIALTRRNLTVTKRICSIFVKCTLPKKKKKTPAKGLLKNTSSRDVFTLLDGSQEVSASSTACAPAEENLLISIKRYYFAVCYNGLHFNRDRAWHWWTDSHLTLDIIGIGNRMSESTLYLFLQYKLLQWT